LFVPFSAEVEFIRARKLIWEHQRNWRRAFLPSGQQLRGLEEWEAVASKMAPASVGGAAVLDFEHALCSGLHGKQDLLISETLGRTGLLLAKQVEPSACLPVVNGWENNLYITAADYSWTFVRTHEEPHIGPFFLRALPSFALTEAGWD